MVALTGEVTGKHKFLCLTSDIPSTSSLSSSGRAQEEFKLCSVIKFLFFLLLRLFHCFEVFQVDTSEVDWAMAL